MSSHLAADPPSDRLLRTLAPVPVSSPVLDLGCGSGQHTEALLRLGFPVHACDSRPEAVQETRALVRELVDEETAQSCVQETSLQALDEVDATFDWVIGDRTEAFADSSAELETLLRKAHALLSPGGWFYLTVPAASESEKRPAAPADSRHLDDRGLQFVPSDLEMSNFDIAFVESRSPSWVEENGEARVHALYRRIARSAPG